MGLNRWKVDSVANRKQKTRAELQAENERLKAEVSALGIQLEDTQVALCDVFEQMMEVLGNG